MNPSNFVPAVHFQTIWQRCVTLENLFSTVCNHAVIKILFFYTMYEGSDISHQLENVTHTLEKIPMPPLRLYGGQGSPL